MEFKFSKQAKKFLSKLSKTDRERILEGIEIVWRNIPEEKATEEELEIFAKYQKGDEEYQCVFSVDEV